MPRNTQLIQTQVIVICSSLLGKQLGDPPAPWFDAVTNTFGGILYIATGALVVEFYTNALGPPPPPARDAGLAMGSFSLITGPHKMFTAIFNTNNQSKQGLNSTHFMFKHNAKKYHFQDVFS